jgi:hypothetical protein
MSAPPAIYVRPARIICSSSFPPDDADTLVHLTELVGELMQLNLWTAEVHIKLSKKQHIGGACGYAYYTYDQRPFADQSYHAYRPNTLPRVNYLITAKLFQGYRERFANGRTCVRHYPRMKTAPYTTVYTWEEDFVYLMAHEMQHIAQYQRGRNARGRASASELECEYYAIRILQLYRAVMYVVSPQQTVGQSASNNAT